MRLNGRSLRVRLCLWYLTVTVAWMLVFGTVSTLYLAHTLESARQVTLERRTERLVRFLEAWRDLGSRGQTQQELLRRALWQFSLVSPRGDLLEVADAASGELYASPEAKQIFPWSHAVCTAPCYRLVDRNGHRLRLLQQTVAVDGRQLRVSMAGEVDEHEDMLRLVRRSYVLFLPVVVFGSVAGGLLLGQFALEPVDRMTRAASTISLEDLGRRLPVPPTGDEVQRLAEAWNDLLERLEVAVEQLKQFTGDLSHDLRTAMTVMSASAEVTLRRERTRAEYRETLRTVLLECKATTALIDDLLAASRSKQAGESIVRAPVQISELVSEVCEQFCGMVEAKQQTLRTEVAAGVWVLGEASLVRRLLGILLDNAVKYASEASAISVLLRQNREEVELQVTDTGPGISPADLDHIFDRFYRAESSRSRETAGNGLGLSIAQWIAQAHGSDIQVMSQLGRGSSFTIRFARAEPRAARPAKYE